MSSTSSTAPASAPLTLPPYGYMSVDQYGSAVARARPSKWNEDQSAWDAWFDRVLALIGENVWPVHRNGAWKRTPAEANAMELTKADLGVMREFGKAYIRATVGTTGLYHVELLDREDHGDGWPPSIGLYCPELADARFNLEKLLLHALFDYAGQFLPQSFKLHLQRPRPFQAAFILDWNDPFPHHPVTSGNTPALISGHAVQGLIVGCVAFESILPDTKLAERNRAGLQAWMTGVGDRRVMAGVHYPSDSLASWIVAAEMVDYLFADPAIRHFLLEAIRGSLLYKFLDPRVPKTPAYRLAWDCLLATLHKPSSKA